MRLLAALVGAVAVLTAGPAAASPQPANDADLVRLPGASQGARYFLPVDQTTGAGVVEFWLLSVSAETETVDAVEVTATWLHGRLDCPRRLVTPLATLGLGTDLTVARHGEVPPPRQVEPNSISQRLYDHLCTAARPAVDGTFPDVAAAIRAVRAPDQQDI